VERKNIAYYKYINMVVPFLIDHMVSANLFLGYNSTFRHASMSGYISHTIGMLIY